MLASLNECQTFSEKLSAVLVLFFFLLFPISLAAGNILLLLCIGSFLLSWLSSRSNASLQSLVFPLCISSLSLFGLILVGGVYSQGSTEEIFFAIRKYSNLLMLPFFYLFLKDKPRLVASAVLAYCAAMALTITSVYLSIFTPLPWANTQETGIASDRSIFEDHIVHGLLVSCFIFIAIVKAIDAQSAMFRLIWGGLSLAALINLLYLTTGRTGIVVTILALTCAIFFSVSGLKKITLVALIGLGTISVYHTSTLMQNRFTQAYHEISSYQQNYRTSVGERIHYYKNSLKLIQDNPWLGYGTGAYKSAICTKVAENECSVFNWHPHNQYLFFWIENGFLGVLLYLAYILSPIASLQKMPTSLLSRKILVIGVVSTLAINSFINSPLWSSTENKIFTYLFLLLTLYALNLKRK